MTGAVGTGTMSYVYAVGRAADAHAAGDLVAAGGLRFVTEGGLAAVVASVPADEFGSRALEARLNDLDRLETLARTHNGVVDRSHAHMTVLPMRLATVYLDDARVADVLRERADEFGSLLDWLEDHVELGVKVYATAVAEPEPEPEPATGQAESPGRAYLRRRQAARRSHRNAYRAAGEVAAAVPRVAAPLARARAVHRPQQGELAAQAGGGRGENIANEAYLVARSDVADFRRTVEELVAGAPGVHVEVTGPWAPYSFAEAGRG